MTLPAGLPRDLAQWLSLALAVTAMALARPLTGRGSRPRLFAALAALAAAALSAAYVIVYLRGGPRIIDATSYFLQARGFSRGLVSFPLGEPETSVLGRFLVRSEGPEGARAGVIFPPGYAAVLSLGFRAGAPLAVGPVLAAAIALCTFDLAGRIAPAVAAPGSVSLPRLALLFSVTCAALRYHTADTMSHGLAALCVAVALSLVFRAADAPTARRAAILAAGAGLASGWLFATRPASAVALALVLAFVLLRDGPARASAPRLLAALALGALPGLAFLAVQQRLVTGAWGVSSQRLYYEVSDGPPGCFRYGFGAGVGCLGEHGDFVSTKLGGGYGLVAAVGTTLRRLKMHLVNPANLELLALLVPAGAWLGRASVRVRALGLFVVLQILVYVPFYFDGNYPGGGARFFCDALPVEHVLAAVAVVAGAARRGAPHRWAAGAVALSLAGFAFRAGFDHAMLRDRDGGRPFFEPAALARAGVERGLLFVDSDHGLDLAFDPAPSGGVEAVRFHGDALDRFTWQARGRPPAFRYRFEGDGLALVSVEPLAFPPLSPGSPLIIEGESLWPALAQEGGWALPEWAAGTCASAERWLEIRSATTAPTSISVGLPARRLAGRKVSVRLALGGGVRGAITLAGRTVPFGGPAGAPAGLECFDLPPILVPSGTDRLSLTVRLDGAPSAGVFAALDALRVEAGEND